MKPEFPQDKFPYADIRKCMKTICVLFAGQATKHAFSPLIGGPSAFDRALERAQAFPDVARVLVLSSAPLSSSSTVAFDQRTQDRWTVSSFFSVLAMESAGFDHAFVFWADVPFIDPKLTDSLYRKHLRYAAEYTFADGYPYGLAPEILAGGLLPILSGLTKDCADSVSRTAIFDAVKRDINSFDIETEIAPTDLRQLRLELACDTKRNAMLCESLEGITAENYAERAKSRGFALRTLPSFYAVQVAAKCPFECLYCPYPDFCQSGKGRSPGKKATELDAYMPRSSFAALLDKITDFSEDAVVSLSLWGECSYHPEIAGLVADVLARPSLSVLIETTGIGWSRASLDSIAAAVRASSPRANGQNPINWIVSLDAVGSALYGQAHGLADGATAPLRDAMAFTQDAAALFPGMVWPQMVRMNENEAELEPFYRFWKEKLGRVIVQKHDHFCRSIPDRRVADLSPLVRTPCWHLKRDMCILLDGTVPFCREDLYASRSCGNALADDLESIWAGNRSLYEQHVCGIHEGMCGACDEYYTYNF
jgi:spiro-SPASM protein